MNAAEKVVCVTGASGFIASWLVKLLLQLGYTVRATVRDPNDPKKTKHLLSLDGAKERLHLKDLLDTGENTFPSTYRFVDVRDVAYAHIQAFDIPPATGRYCLVERHVQFPEILKTLNELYPTLGLQEKCKDQDKLHEPIFRISQEKAKSLGLSFIPWDVSLRETIESLKEKGFLSI